MTFTNNFAKMKMDVEPITPVLHYLNDHSENCLWYAKPIFGIEFEQGNCSAYSSTRLTTSSQSIRAYNFTRSEVTQVGLNGFRAELVPLHADAQFWNITSTGFLTLRPVSNSHVCDAPLYTDLQALSALLAKMKIDPTAHVVIVCFKRIVASTREALRESVRSICASDEMIRQIEINNATPIPIGNGIKGYYRDILTVTLISEEDIAKYESVLDVYTGVQLTSYGLDKAPAHVFDLRVDLVHAGAASAQVRFRGENMATYAIYYHDVEPIPLYTRDVGIVIAIPIIQDRHREEGFYKQWYEYDEKGKLRLQTTFIPIDKLKENLGFFKTRMQARAWCPESEVKEFKNILREIVAKRTAALADAITSINRAFALKLQTLVRDIFAASLRRFDRATEAERSYEKLKAEVEKERQAHNREKEELKRQANKNKDISSNIAGTLKVVTSVIALITTGIIPLIKAKKKET